MPAVLGAFYMHGHASRGDETVNTFRALAQYQDDISASDLTVALYEYDGAPEGIDLLLSHSSVSFDHLDIIEDSDSVPPLALALSCYSRNFFVDIQPRRNALWGSPWTACPSERKKWEPLIKRLIPRGTDLHVRVPRRGKDAREYCPFHVNEYGTPLDVLFEFSGTPDEAKILGTEWLELLASKGHDVVVYLKKEMMLHSPQHQLTHPTSSYHQEYLRNLRELQFVFEDTRPRVWWEWWTNPTSDIHLLEREFRMMVKHIPMRPRIIGRSLNSPWPFHYPVWHHVEEERAQSWPKYLAPAEVRRRGDLAMQRANRRLQKRHAKSTRSRRSRGPQIPGAWPAES